VNDLLPEVTSEPSHVETPTSEWSLLTEAVRAAELLRTETQQEEDARGNKRKKDDGPKTWVFEKKQARGPSGEALLPMR
jgi:hypothetical protein